MPAQPKRPMIPRGRLFTWSCGRAAEKVVFGDLTTGAESEIQNLTQIARSMVGGWGMSDAIGAIAVTDGRSTRGPGGRGPRAQARNPTGPGGARQRPDG